MTKIRIGLKYGIAVLAMVLFVAFAIGCVSGTDGTSLEDAYKAAIEDAKIANESEISDLIPIVESNDYLIWKGEPGNKRVLVLTLVPYAYSSTYVGHEGENLTISWGYSWVTVVPEVKEFIQNCTVSEENLTLRVEQLLGLPPKNESKICVELWVDPDDLFRPCPDSGITYTESQLDFPANVSRDHVMWFFECLTSVYYGDTFYKGLMSFNHTGAQRCPWTRLGYTYDWSNPESEIGASEFVIRKNSVVTIESASNTSDYFSVAPSFDPELAQKLQTALDSAVNEFKVPGAVMVVRSPNGATWTGTSGLANLEDETPMCSDMHLRIGSVTKTYTATVILQLVDEGLLRLNGTIEETLPDIDVVNGDEITIGQLLEMRSGLGDYSKNETFGEQFSKDPLRVWTPSELIWYSNYTQFEPGERYDYNNANYILLGMIIEKVTGRTYQEEVTSRIIEPLGLNNTVVPTNTDMPSPYAHGYLYDLYENGTVIDVTFALDPSWAWSAGDMISTAEDQLVWIDALLTGKLLSNATQAERFKMKEARTSPHGPISYGLGVADLNGAIGHNGNYNDLYTAMVCRYKDFDFVVLSNGQDEGGTADSNADNIFWKVVEDIGLYPNLEKVAEFEGGYLYKAGKIHVVQLNGNYREMGRQYGELLKPQINSFYKKAIVEHFPSGSNISREEIEAFARRNYERYPARIKEVFNGMAETSGLSVDKLILLDQYVVLAALPYFAGCSGIAAWGDYTGGGPLVFGKNEDFDLLFKEFDDALVVVVYNPDDGSRSVASVCNAGQVGTMNEMSDAGLVLAMNQAPMLEKLNLSMNRIPLFINYLSFFFDSTNFETLDAEFQSYRPPAPFIVNAADKNKAYSFESSINDCKLREAQKDGLLSATNHYIDPSWDIPEKVLASEGWKESEERRNNLLALGEKHKGKIDASVLMEILDTPKSEGGATVPHTIFQFVAVPDELKIWVKAPGYQDWVEVDVDKLFNRNK